MEIANDSRPYWVIHIHRPCMRKDSLQPTVSYSPPRASRDQLGATIYAYHAMASNLNI